jgi:hypothetical protein
MRSWILFAKWIMGLFFMTCYFQILNKIEFALKMTKKFNTPSKYDKNTSKSCRLLSKLNEENDQNFSQRKHAERKQTSKKQILKKLKVQ